MRQNQLKQILARAEEEIRLGLLDHAVASYQEVLSLAREGEFECELAHLRLGDLHLGQGRSDLALRHLRCAQTLDADEPEYALMIGRALIALEKPEEASAQLFEALSSPWHTGDALAELAIAADLGGDRQTAGLLARKATAFNPEDPQYRALARTFADA